MLRRLFIGLVLVSSVGCKIKTDEQYKTDLKLAMTEGMIAGYGLAQEEIVTKCDAIIRSLKEKPQEKVESLDLEQQMELDDYIMRS